MTRAAASAVLLVGLSGCAGGPPVLVADPAFSAGELEDFHRAAAEWCRAADAAWACVSAVPGRFEQPTWRGFGGRPLLVRASQDTDVFRGSLAEFGPWISGIHRGGSIALFPHAMLSRWDWVQTSVHEIGHLLGLDHGDGEAMGTSVTCVDARSLLNLCARRRCGPNAAPTCSTSP